MAKFADRTSVPVDQSRTEVERTLARYGATAFAYMTAAGKVIIAFEANGRHIKITVPIADGGEKEKRAARQKWRALLLVIKAKLESVESGIETLEEAFYANIVLPDGLTVYEKTRESVKLAYQSGKVQALLPDYSKSGQ